MRINVLLFGPQAVIAKTDSVSIELAEPASVSAAIAALCQTIPALEPSLKSSRLAVNHDYAGPDDLLTNEDEVALIGMVSGG